MFERFTEGARQVVVRAQENARRLGHNYIGCEHLLLAAAEAGGRPAWSCATRASRQSAWRRRSCAPSAAAPPARRPAARPRR